jgi:hypothetical protein
MPESSNEPSELKAIETQSGLPIGSPLSLCLFVIFLSIIQEGFGD